MTKVFVGNLVLEKDSVFEEDIEVEGSILGKGGERFNLTVKGSINAGHINVGNINAGHINVGNINAGDINAEDIDARDINATDINAKDINAKDINAWNINAGNIIAQDIEYRAVCFAYRNIKCKSIKGRRENAKHFCLDGKITTKKLHV